MLKRLSMWHMKNDTINKFFAPNSSTYPVRIQYTKQNLSQCMFYTLLHKGNIFKNPRFRTNPQDN